MNVKSFPAEITSYDLLKTFAVLTMIIDHIGLYFFPDEMWWRTIGRLSFPVWLFLIGYANSREISPFLIGGAAIVFASNILAGMGVFPFSILVSIIVVRLTLDPIMNLLSKSALHLWVGSGVLFIIALPSFILFEFGAQAFIFAIFGYLARRQQSEKDRAQVFRYAVFVAMGYIFLQSFGYALFGLKFVVLTAGVAAVTLALYKFAPKTYPELTQKIPPAGKALVQVCGRHTLKIYVVHLLIFKTIAVLSGASGYVFMNWSWVW